MRTGRSRCWRGRALDRAGFCTHAPCDGTPDHRGDCAAGEHAAGGPCGSASWRYRAAEQVVISVGDAAMGAYWRMGVVVAASVTAHVARVRTGRGSGSAVVGSGDGYLLTNAHVVGSARRGELVFADGAETRFDVVGADPLSDLAVLR